MLFHRVAQTAQQVPGSVFDRGSGHGDDVTVREGRQCLIPIPGKSVLVGVRKNGEDAKGRRLSTCGSAHMEDDGCSDQSNGRMRGKENASTSKHIIDVRCPSACLLFYFG